jgi:hypothetical protein
MYVFVWQPSKKTECVFFPSGWLHEQCYLKVPHHRSRNQSEGKLANILVITKRLNCFTSWSFIYGVNYCIYYLSIRDAKALYSCEAEHSHELSFPQGAMFTNGKFEPQTDNSQAVKPIPLIQPSSRPGMGNFHDKEGHIFHHNHRRATWLHTSTKRELREATQFWIW